jgi:hypothetical protein
VSSPGGLKITFLVGLVCSLAVGRDRSATVIQVGLVNLCSGCPGLDSRQGQESFLLSETSRPDLGPTQPPIHWERIL